MTRSAASVDSSVSLECREPRMERARCEAAVGQPIWRTVAPCGPVRTPHHRISKLEAEGQRGGRPRARRAAPHPFGIESSRRATPLTRYGGTASAASGRTSCAGAARLEQQRAYSRRPVETKARKRLSTVAACTCRHRQVDQNDEELPRAVGERASVQSRLLEALAMTEESIGRRITGRWSFGAHTSDTPASAVRLCPGPPSPGRSTTFRESSSSTTPMKHPGAQKLPRLAGSCKRSASLHPTTSRQPRGCHGAMNLLILHHARPLGFARQPASPRTMN